MMSDSEKGIWNGGKTFKNKYGNFYDDEESKSNSSLSTNINNLSIN